MARDGLFRDLDAALTWHPGDTNEVTVGSNAACIQVAYSFRKPVLVTNVGGLPDVVTDDQTGFVVEPFDSEAIADRVCTFFDEEKAEQFKTHIEEEAYRFSWDRMAEVIEGLMKQ